MKRMLLAVFFAASLGAQIAPVMTVPDKVLFESKFESTNLEKSNFSAKQGTRWSVEGGVLRGLPSTPEYQASKKDHKGTEARLSFGFCPAEFALSCRVRFGGGQYTAATPMVELGHHVSRMQFSSRGAKLLVDHEALQVAGDSNFALKTNEWYMLGAEVRGDEILFRIEGGPTWYGKHPSVNTNQHAFGIAGFKGGTVEIDDVVLWSLKPGDAPGWEALRASLPASKPVEAAKPAAPARPAKKKAE